MRTLTAKELQTVHGADITCTQWLYNKFDKGGRILCKKGLHTILHQISGKCVSWAVYNGLEYLGCPENVLECFKTLSKAFGTIILIHDLVSTIDKALGTI